MGALNFLYNELTARNEVSLSDPITILSEFLKSSKAEPSLKNSGLLQNWIFPNFLLNFFCIFSVVPGVTVLFITIIFLEFIASWLNKVFVTEWSWLKFIFLVLLSKGVSTHIKIISAEFIVL